MFTSNAKLFSLSSYSPGDVVMIQPQNSEDTVDEFLSMLNLDPDRCFTLQQNDPGKDKKKVLLNLLFYVWLS